MQTTTNALSPFTCSCPCGETCNCVVCTCVGCTCCASQAASPVASQAK